MEHLPAVPGTLSSHNDLSYQSPVISVSARLFVRAVYCVRRPSLPPVMDANSKTLSSLPRMGALSLGVGSVVRRISDAAEEGVCETTVNVLPVAECGKLVGGPVDAVYCVRGSGKGMEPRYDPTS